MPSLGGKIFGAKPQKFGAVGAFLENFGQIFEKLWLKNAIVKFGQYQLIIHQLIAKFKSIRTFFAILHKFNKFSST